MPSLRRTGQHLNTWSSSVSEPEPSFVPWALRGWTDRFRKGRRVHNNDLMTMQCKYRSKMCNKPFYTFGAIPKIIRALLDNRTPQHEEAKERTGPQEKGKSRMVCGKISSHVPLPASVAGPPLVIFGDVGWEGGEVARESLASNPARALEGLATGLVNTCSGVVLT